MKKGRETGTLGVSGPVLGHHWVNGKGLSFWAALCRPRAPVRGSPSSLGLALSILIILSGQSVTLNALSVVQPSPLSISRTLHHLKQKIALPIKLWRFLNCFSLAMMSPELMAAGKDPSRCVKDEMEKRQTSRQRTSRDRGGGRNPSLSYRTCEFWAMRH